MIAFKSAAFIASANTDAPSAQQNSQQSNSTSQTETEPSRTASKLGLYFPLEQQGDKVVVSQACLINKSTILEKGTILCTLFNMPSTGDFDVKEAQRRIDQQNAYTKQGGLDRISRPSAKAEALRSRALQTRWNDHLVFRAMLNRAGAEDLFLVYLDPQKQPVIEPLALPEDTVFLESDNGVEVGWVHPEKNALPERRGFRTGDIIKTFDGQPTPKLAAFKDAYNAWKSAPRQPQATIEVYSTADKCLGTVILKSPPSLNGGVLDMF